MGRRKKGDDRPFLKHKKPILPIRGFKGNRVIYGDTFDVEEEPDQAYFVQSNDYHHKDLGPESDEPMYSEPNFALSDAISTPSISTESGYHSHEVLATSTPQSISYPLSESDFISLGPSCSSRGYMSDDDDDDERLLLSTGTGLHIHSQLLTVKTDP